ncbi:MAG: PIN domain-containing protein [Candidatus Korobacteraceae bacterium]
MRASALIDTGAILAILRPRDVWHRPCADALMKARVPLLTSEAVLTEVFHLIGTQRSNVEAAWRFVRSGALTVGTITDADLAALAALMHRYHDRPMDFADATLVHLAQRESLSTIFTVDISDFQTYRVNGHKRFRILPGATALS